MSLKKKFNKAGKGCTVTFQLPTAIADGATDIKILGDFNAWDAAKGIPMVRKNGVFEASVDLESNKEHQFRYLINDQTWINDPEADKFLPSPFGVDNSVVVAIK